MESKIYTAQEMREAAVSPTYVGGVSEVRVKPEVYEMLEQAADIQERCEKAVESMHTQLMHLANEGKTTVDIGRLSKYFAHLKNILRGDAGNDNENK